MKNEIFMCSAFAENGEGQPYTINMLVVAQDKEQAKSGCTEYTITHLNIDESWKKLYVQATLLTDQELALAMQKRAENRGDVQ